MPTDYRAVDAKCPYYKGEDNRRIECEGVCGAKKLTLSFARANLKDRYAKKYCDTMKYTKCQVYAFIAKKYEEE